MDTIKLVAVCICEEEESEVCECAGTGKVLVCVPGDECYETICPNMCNLSDMTGTNDDER
jgi:hypothetical protein